METKTYYPPPWFVCLEAAVSKNRRDAHNRYFQLASNGIDGWPNVRTVVFRGFFPNSNSLTFVSDARSQKKEEFAADSRAQICWYFSRTREQFRIRGYLGTLDEKNTITRVWSNLSESAQKQFFWLNSGLPLGEGTSPVNAAEPPDSFKVFCLNPKAVDHLRLGEKQIRTRSILRGKIWIEEFLNP